MEPGQFQRDTSPVQCSLIPPGLSQELVEGALIVFVKEQGVDSGNCFLIPGNQTGDVFAKMLDLLIGLKHRCEGGKILKNNVRKLDNGQSHHAPP